MGIRDAFNRGLSKEASPKERTEVLDAMNKIYGAFASKGTKPAMKEMCQDVLKMLTEVENVKVYPWRLTPRHYMDCFGSSFDFRYQEPTKTLEIGGSLEDLYSLASSV